LEMCLTTNYCKYIERVDEYNADFMNWWKRRDASFPNLSP